MTELHQTYELVPDAEIQQTSFRERMACSRIGRAAIGGITAVSLAVSGTVATASPSAAESSHTYTVTGTGGEGVWLHGDPGAGDEDDLIKIMPEGAQFTADCYVNDTPIGERSNPVWLHGRDASGTEGYFTDYYSSSRWSAEDKSDLPPLCGEAPVQHNSQQQNSAYEPKSLFYSPLDSPTGLSEVKVVADINRPIKDWSLGDCSPAKALENIPDTVDTLAGWSKGRLGPVYFLASANENQKDQIRNIILLDPGAKSDMARNRLAEIRGRKTCDWHYDPSELLADWLQKNESNRLTIVTGSDTEMKEDKANMESHSTFEGLWEFYLAKSWNQPFADRVNICDYNGMSHEDVLRKTAHTIKERDMGCTAIEGYRLTEWHP